MTIIGQRFDLTTDACKTSTNDSCNVNASWDVEKHGRALAAEHPEGFRFYLNIQTAKIRSELRYKLTPLPQP